MLGLLEGVEDGGLEVVEGEEGGVVVKKVRDEEVFKMVGGVLRFEVVNVEEGGGGFEGVVNGENVGGVGVGREKGRGKGVMSEVDLEGLGGGGGWGVEELRGGEGVGVVGEGGGGGEIGGREVSV